MKKSKNKFRHKWIDDGGKKTPKYIYQCQYCGNRKIKQDSFSCIYYDSNWIFVSNKAMECVEH